MPISSWQSPGGESNLDDLSRWGRSDGLQIVLLAIGAVLAARFIHWLGGRFAFGAAAAAVEAGVPIDERDKRRRAVVQALERAAVGIFGSSPSS